MKTIILVFGMMLGTTVCNLLEGQVPDAVLKSFMEQYPQSRLREWVVKNDTCIAMFINDKNKDMAYYLPGGQWVKTETKIPWTKDLPPAVRMSWKYCAFDSWYVDAIKEVKYPDKELYVMKVEKECGPEGSIPGDCAEAYKLYFDGAGNMVKKVQTED